MRRRYGELVWGVLIILAGMLFLMDNLGLLPGRVSAWQLIFPLALVILGAWFILGPLLLPRTQPETQTLTLPLGALSAADVRFLHGAGRLEVRALNDAANLLSGTFVGGVEYRLDDSLSPAKIKLKVPGHDWFFEPWQPPTPDGLRWDVALTSRIPLRLRFKTGACQSYLDLSDLQVNELRLSTGASSNELTLPARAGYTRVEIEAGVGSVTVHFPAGVAGRIHMSGGMAAVNIDSGRFPRQGEVYESAGFESAPNRAEIFIQTGVGSVQVS